MRLAVLTTDTLHHAYFLREVSARYPVGLVLVEQGGVEPLFPTEHAIERLRDRFEQIRFFDGNNASVNEFGDVMEVESVNSEKAKSAIKEFAPDAVIVFGTGIIRPDVIALCSDNMLNLHGGDPERYRGLDSHLWAIYHNDFSGLITTIHRVNPELDDGDLVLQEGLRFERGVGLEQLRAVNTEACVRLSLAALDMLARQGRIVSRPQTRVGRYYSFMPSCLKDVCVFRFARHVEEME
jgi:methionyl-tRNA formyltransferase